MYAHSGHRHKKKVKELERKLKEMELAGNVSSSLSTTHTVLNMYIHIQYYRKMRFGS